MADDSENIEPGISDEQFQKLADSPKNVRGDEGSVTERDASDLIDMDRYVKGKEAAKNGPPYGMRMSSIVYGDTT